VRHCYQQRVRHAAVEGHHRIALALEERGRDGIRKFKSDVVVVVVVVVVYPQNARQEGWIIHPAAANDARWLLQKVLSLSVEGR
jgi:hypothetical protein